jgi:hypothetical protein
MDKNLQYPIAKYLPVGAPQFAYTPRRTHGDISGGNVWDAAWQFRDAGIAAEFVRRLQEWGIAFTDREARLQYHYHFGLRAPSKFQPRNKMALGGCLDPGGSQHQNQSLGAAMVADSRPGHNWWTAVFSGVVAPTAV